MSKYSTAFNILIIALIIGGVLWAVSYFTTDAVEAERTGRSSYAADSGYTIVVEEDQYGNVVVRRIENGKRTDEHSVKHSWETYAY